MDIIQLYEDFNISYMTEGHKHCRPGWVNVECPFCTGNPGLHLGFNLKGNNYVCWRCGWHPVVPTISKLIATPEKQTKEIIKQYGLLIALSRTSEIKIKIKPHRFPSNTGPLLENHKRYLEQRKFDPSLLIQTWGILGTGPISKLEKIDYKHRIIIPFIWENQQVSFDSRDITNHHPFKYMACPKERELIPHKSILYGKQEKWKETGICVEGPTDVWRFGVYSFATSGIKYTPAQVRVMAKAFKRIAVCYDGGETQALTQANLLIADLRFRGVDAFRVDIKGDPGSMPQDEATYLVKQLI